MKVSFERLLGFGIGAVVSTVVASTASAEPAPDDDELSVAAKATPSAPNEGAAPAPPSAAASGAVQGASAPVPAPSRPSADESDWRRPYSLSGFVQGEYQAHQDSQDELAQGGTLLNRDRFLLRRARVRVDGDWRYAHLQLEVDGNTARGPQLRVLHGFATLRLPQVHPTPETADVPLAAVSLGLFDTPFGRELVEAPRTRAFMERSLASLSLFPGEPDVGVRFYGGIRFLRWSVAAMNGEPIDERTGYPGLSPHAAKDVVFRVGVDAHPRDDLRITANVSGLRGQGFHAVTDATKGQLTWRDANEDGQVQPSELVASPSTAATPSQSFGRWALGVDLAGTLTTGLGTTTLALEGMLASNLDRALFVADPVLLGANMRELGYSVALTQQLTPRGILGVRYDFYDPNSDFLDKRGGKLVPESQAVQTLSPVVGYVLRDGAKDRAKLLFQYDFVKNHFARDLSGVPTNLRANTATLRLQVEL